MVSLPGSLEDMLSMYTLPSATTAAPLIARVGATLPTVTVILLTLLCAPSESATCTVTSLEAGPSGKVQSKLPAPVVGSKAGLDRTPLVPQLVLTSVNVSWPGSLVL